MKARFTCVALLAAVLMLVGGCGGGSGGSSDGGSGTVTMSVTDAKPVIDPATTEVWITFEEVLAHKSGGGWESLPLPESPLKVNLFAFSNGETTDLVPPVQLDSGKYTQLRFVVSEAKMLINNVETPIDLDVPSGFLRIDKNFTFDVPDGGTVDLTVDFDLSQSIVLEGNGAYKLKPVLHLVGTDEAATIHGTIASDTFTLFDADNKWAVVSVTWDKKSENDGTDEDETYTRVWIEKSTTGNGDTDFTIFWLVPGEDYIVEVDVNDDGFPDRPKVTVAAEDLPRGAAYDLGNAI